MDTAIPAPAHLTSPAGIPAPAPAAGPALQALAARKEEVLSTLLSLLEKTLGLRREDLDLEQPLLEFGVSSMELVAAFRALQDTFGVRPSMRRVFQEFYTLDRLAGYLAELILEKEARPDEPVEPRVEPPASAASRLPLTDAQEMLRFLAQYSPGGAAAYQELTVLELRGRLDAGALQVAWDQATARHEALRASLDLEGRELVITAERTGGLALHHLTAPPAGQLSALRSWLQEEAARPLDLDRELVRAALVQVGPEHHLLTVTAHEIAADRPAIGSLLAEVGDLYTAAMEGRAPALPPAAGLREAARAWAAPGSAEARAAEAFWRARFDGGVPRLELPADFPRPAVKGYAGLRLVLVLTAEETERLRRWGAGQRAPLSLVLLALFEAWLHHASGEEELLVGVVARGQQAGGLPRIAARCNPQPLRLTVRGEQRLSELLRALETEIATLADHDTYPFARVVRLLDPERDQSRSAIFTAGFSVDPVLPTPRLHGLRACWAAAPQAWSRYDLDLQVTESPAGLQVGCTFTPELFRPDTMRRWMGTWRELLRALPTLGDPHVADLPVVPADEARMLDAWAWSARRPAPETSIVALLEAQASRTPDEPALHAGERSISFRALHAAANRIARKLRALGVGRDDRVAVCLERTPRLVEAILGVLKAGAAYVPLDPTWPEPRRALILEDSGARVALSDGAAPLPPSEGLVVVDLSDPAALAGEVDAAAPPVDVQPDDLAYVLFTSGSTGRPKGVAVSHRGVVNLLVDCAERFGSEERRGVLFSTSVCFDISVFELLLPLCFGGALVLARNALELPELPQAHRVTLVNTVPSAMAELVALELPPGLRVVVLGGEPLRDELVARVLAASRVQRVVNGYGPTETTIYTTFDEVHRDQPRPMTIGRPVANVEVRVLRANGRPAPLGAVGELWVGGPGVAREYLGDPARTAERFVSEPTSGTRYYRTGDLVRWDADGRLRFVGRRDHQIKLRGFRIELGETEAALLRHPAVQDAVALVRPGAGGTPALLAWVARRAGAQVSAGELTASLRAQLPAYCVPGAVTVMEALPRLPNGKVDRAALPAPELGGPSRARVAPRSSSEALMARLWERVLGLPEVGVEDDFFELGGHSLLITPLLVAIRDAFDVRLSVRTFFRVPTVAGAVKAVYAAREKATAAPAPFDQASPEVARRYAELLKDAVLAPEIGPEDEAYTWVSEPRCIVLTGATGFLGTHLLAELLRQTRAQVVALVRARDPEHGLRRVVEAMRSFGTWEDAFQGRIEAVVGELSRHLLGLTPGTFDALAERTDLLVHNGAVVNFIYPYSALKQVNVEGTREMIRLAFRKRRKPLHFISTVAVLPMGGGRRFLEEGSLDHGLHLNMAYDESKWVAEKLVHAAGDRGLPVAIYRPGEVSGHSETGQCVPEHFLYSVLAGSVQRAEAPRSSSNIDLTPVDYAARSIAWMARQKERPGRTFHIVNPSPLHISRILDWARTTGYEFRLLALGEWRDRLLRDPEFGKNPLYPFAAVLEEFHQVHLEFPDFDCRQTQEALEDSGIVCPPVDDRLLKTYLDYFVKVGFLPPPGGPRLETMRVS